MYLRKDRFKIGTATNRRVIVGLNEQGQSAVMADAADLAIIKPTSGITLQEVWRQQDVPARVENVVGPRFVGALEAPPHGAVIRILTIEPFAGSQAEWVPNLHFDDSLHVITMTSGQLDIVLEDGEVTLAPGDSIVLPGSVHDLRNSSGSKAVFVYTSFPLAR